MLTSTVSTAPHRTLEIRKVGWYLVSQRLIYVLLSSCAAKLNGKTYFFISYQPLWHSTFLNGISRKLSRKAKQHRSWWRAFVLTLKLSTKVSVVRLRTVCLPLLQSMFVSNWNLLYIRIYRGFQLVLVGMVISSTLIMWFMLCTTKVIFITYNSTRIHAGRQLCHLWQNRPLCASKYI